MTLASCDEPLIAGHDAVLLDLDGVVYRGGDAIAGAVEALSAVDGVPVAYLTNNANRSPAAVVDHLRRLGLAVEDDDVVTSAQAIARVIAADLPAGSVVFTVGGDGLRAALEDRGLTPTGDRRTPEVTAVVQGYSPDLGWRDLAEAAYAVEAGLPWYASNTDLTIPTADGIAPGNGSLVHAVRLATGQEPVVAGKPYAPLFEETMARIDSRRPLMVGDRLDTDILGARRAGIASLLVLTGVNSLADALAANPDERPDFVGDDLAALHRPQRAVEIDADGLRARCDGVEVELRDDVVVQHGSGGDRTALQRAALALGWARRDDTGAAVVLDERIDP